MIALFEQPVRAMIRPTSWRHRPSRQLLSLGLARYANEQPDAVLRQLGR